MCDEKEGSGRQIPIRAVYRNFSKAGQIWGTNKRGGAEAYVRCYTLYLLGGGENDTRGGKCPSPPPPPLNTALPMSINMPQLIFQKAESAPPLPSQMSQAALSGGQGDFCLRGGGGGGDPSFPTPLYETLRGYTLLRQLKAECTAGQEDLEQQGRQKAAHTYM